MVVEAAADAPLTAAAAAEVRFDAILDLSPADGGPCLLALRGSGSARRPLSYDMLRPMCGALSRTLLRGGVPAGSRPQDWRRRATEHTYRWPRL